MLCVAESFSRRGEECRRRQHSNFNVGITIKTAVIGKKLWCRAEGGFVTLERRLGVIFVGGIAVNSRG